MLKKAVAFVLTLCILCAGASCSKKKPTSRKERERQKKIEQFKKKARKTLRDAEIAASDAALTAKIKAKLFLDDELKGADIEVRTEKKVVYLTGTVHSPEIRKRAEKLAREVEGLSAVFNKIRVVSEASEDTGR